MLPASDPSVAVSRPSLVDAATAASSITPDVIGLDLPTACETAAWAGISLGVQRVERSRGPFDVVVAQSPAPGTRLRPMWRLHVLISSRSAGTLESG